MARQVKLRRNQQQVSTVECKQPPQSLIASAVDKQKLIADINALMLQRQLCHEWGQLLALAQQAQSTPHGNC